MARIAKDQIEYKYILEQTVERHDWIQDQAGRLHSFPRLSYFLNLGAGFDFIIFSDFKVDTSDNVSLHTMCDAVFDDDGDAVYFSPMIPWIGSAFYLAEQALAVCASADGFIYLWVQAVGFSGATYAVVKFNPNDGTYTNSTLIYGSDLLITGSDYNSATMIDSGGYVYISPNEGDVVVYNKTTDSFSGITRSLPGVKWKEKPVATPSGVVQFTGDGNPSLWMARYTGSGSSLVEWDSTALGANRPFATGITVKGPGNIIYKAVNQFATPQYRMYLASINVASGSISYSLIPSPIFFGSVFFMDTLPGGSGLIAGTDFGGTFQPFLSSAYKYNGSTWSMYSVKPTIDYSAPYVSQVVMPYRRASDTNVVYSGGLSGDVPYEYDSYRQRRDGVVKLDYEHDMEPEICPLAHVTNEGPTYWMPPISRGGKMYFVTGWFYYVGHNWNPSTGTFDTETFGRNPTSYIAIVTPKVFVEDDREPLRKVQQQPKLRKVGSAGNTNNLRKVGTHP